MGGRVPAFCAVPELKSRWPPGALALPLLCRNLCGLVDILAGRVMQARLEDALVVYLQVLARLSPGAI